MLPKKKELEEKVKSYKKKVKKLKSSRKKLRKKNKKLQKEKRKILKEKKEILEKQGDQIKTLIKKMSDEDVGDLSGDSRKLIERLEKEVFNLKKEVNELDEENEELLAELNKYEVRSEYVIDTDEDILIPRSSEIEGGIKSDSGIEIEDSVVVHGSVESSGEIKIGDKVKIEGDLISKEGEVKLGTYAEIDGIVKGSSIHFGKRSSAKDIECHGDVVFDENTEVDNIIAEGNVTMKNGARSNGKVKFGGEFDGATGITIVGSLKPLTKDEIAEELSD